MTKKISWRHVNCGSAWSPGRPVMDLFDVEVHTGTGASVVVPALQRLRLLFGNRWRQGASVHDTVYDADVNDPDIAGTGTLIGMFKNQNDAWNAVQCHNLLPDLVRAFHACLLTVPTDTVPDAPLGGPCVECGKPVTEDDDKRAIRVAARASVDLGTRVLCPTHLVDFLASH